MLLRRNPVSNEGFNPKAIRSGKEMPLRIHQTCNAQHILKLGTGSTIRFRPLYDAELNTGRVLHRRCLPLSGRTGSCPAACDWKNEFYQTKLPTRQQSPRGEIFLGHGKSCRQRTPPEVYPNLSSTTAQRLWSSFSLSA